ncbi:hypothetical protein GRAN_0288 [Granulicella sibirica]|uniref:Zeta toxin domain-containing protein n=2 Tax=Granulicella sibirica TaxID=2479048 RepID=A0A4Q0T4K9_9BACT|nr:hypothetical protein GRAN_0288 [Granulicella sibirica]
MQTVGVAGGSAIDAGRDVLRNAQELLSKNQSLVVETTLSGSTYLRMMARAKSQGYLLILLFVGTSDVSINMQRVRHRVLLGGHDVPEEDQIRRYPRSMENFRKAFALADEASVFDNSSMQGHRIVAMKGTEGIELFEPVPEWAGFLRDAYSGTLTDPS